MRNRKWIGVVTWSLPAIVLLGLFTRPVKPPQGASLERSATVSIVDWKAVDESVREVFLRAGERSRQHAETQVRLWCAGVRRRAEDDFLPWYFGYWNQQSLALRNAGWLVLDTPLARGMTGSTLTARDRLEELIAREFSVRVLHPVSATRRVEAITRESVRIYLETLNEGLHAVQAGYRISDPEWERYLDGLPGMIRDIEGNRQVPLLVKAGTVAGGSVAFSVTRLAVERIRLMLYRRGQREIMEHSFRAAGGMVARGFGWLATAVFIGWDLHDHHRTVQQNLPVLRRLINDYLDQLEYLVLHDEQTGILATLERISGEMIESLVPVVRAGKAE